MSEKNGLLSVVVPAYNEYANVLKCAKNVDSILSKSKIDHEIIFVDDGSSDTTWDEILKANRLLKNSFGVKFSRNFGKEAAISAGLAESKGDCAVVLDCDLQHPPEKIIEMYEKWQDGYEIVEGVKITRGGESIFKKIGAGFFYSIISRAVGIDMKNASDFKLLDRSAVLTLLNLPERDAFFRALSSWIGYKTTTVRYMVNERSSGESKWGVIKLIKYAVTNISSFTTAPMQIVTILGVVSIIAAVILLIVLLCGCFNGHLLDEIAIIMILLCFIGGMIMVSLGIIGYYLSRVFDQVQGRPRYIVQDKIRSDSQR